MAPLTRLSYHREPRRRSAALGFAAVLLLLLRGAGFSAPEFFVFDNGLGRGNWTPEQQARTAKALGFNGISYNYTNPTDLAVWLETLKAHGLRLYGLYVHTFVDKPEAYDPAFKQAIRLLKGTDAIIWMTVRETGLKGDHDAAAVRIVQDIADQAHTSGVRVALYPHAGFYVATAVDAARVARKAQRPNVGASLNLCHEFLSHQGGRLEATISQTASALLLVSVNGVELATKQYILRLDQGDFDVAAFLKKLQAAGYKGPVGLQCYGIKGNPEENLAASMAAWRRIAAQLEAVR